MTKYESKTDFLHEISKDFVCILPHSALSWRISSAKNLASLSLQDRATKWHYYQANPPHPPNKLWKHRNKLWKHHPVN
jgi:hypothetical protein